MIVTIGKNGAIPLPDELNEANKLEIGDILLCTVTKDKREIRLEKYQDQTLTDEQVAEHGLLTRVETLNPKDFE